MIASARRALAGLVMCGGGSTRMGGDKALLDVRGRPLLSVVAERLAEVADPVLLASGRPGRLGPLGYREVPDAVTDAGPLAGLVAGLEASPHGLMAVVAVDMPFASPALFRLLVELWTDEDAVIPVTGRGLEPLHAVYAAGCEPALRGALVEGRLALHDALATVRVREVGEAEWRAADSTGRFALNLNRPRDLILLREGPVGRRS